MPPPFRTSSDERMCDRLMPEPEPPLKMIPSSRYQLRIAVHRVVDREDEARARLLRHAFTPMLNHTGELNAARWCTSTYLSSARNASASSSSTK